MSLVQLQNINKIFEIGEQPFQALKDINLTIDKGELVAIIGPSGSGKSTLMNIIGLLDKPTSGKYLLDGEDVSRLKENTLARLRNQKIGFVFQTFNLLSRTSALQNVALPLVYSGVSQPARLQRANETLTAVGLADKVNNRPSQLSGGQQQRVAIARSLVTSPEVILADEPTGNLDTKTGDEIIKLFQDLHSKGKTIVIITHSPDIARHAKRIIRVQDGQIEERKKAANRLPSTVHRQTKSGRR